MKTNLLTTNELTFEQKKACINELNWIANEVGNLLGAAIKSSHIHDGITKEDFWRNLFIAKGTNWDAQSNQYLNNRPMKSTHYDDPNNCPADPYREMDLQFWIRYLLDGGSRVINETGSTICYATDSTSLFRFFGIGYHYNGNYPQRRTLCGSCKNVLMQLKSVRNSCIGHITAQQIENSNLKTLHDALDILIQILTPLCLKDWNGRKYAVTLREAAPICFYHSLGELPYSLDQLLTGANLLPCDVDIKVFTDAGIRVEDSTIYLACDPQAFLSTMCALAQMNATPQLWSEQLRLRQTRC